MTTTAPRKKIPLADQVQNAERALASLDKRIAKLQAHIQVLTDRNTALETSIKKKQDRTDKIRHKKSTKTSTLANNDKYIATRQQKVHRHKEKIDTYTTRRDKLQRLRDKKQQVLNSKRAKLSDGE